MLFCHHIFSYYIGRRKLMENIYSWTDTTVREMHRFRSGEVDGAFCQNSIGRVKYRETLTMYCVIWVIVVARFFHPQRNVLNLNHELSSSSSQRIVITRYKKGSSCNKYYIYWSYLVVIMTLHLILQK